MNPKEHLRLLRELAARDGRFAPEAFLFVSEAIAHTVNWVRDGSLHANDKGPDRGGDGEFHVSGQELLCGIQRLARERWGCMAKVVLRQWGLRRTEDFGAIVFLMVEDERMKWKRRDCDSEADFADGYDFETAFEDLEDVAIRT